MCTPPKDSRFVRLPYCIFEGSVEIKVIARNSASKETLRAHFVSQWLAALEGPVMALSDTAPVPRPPVAPAGL